MAGFFGILLLTILAHPLDGANILLLTVPAFSHCLEISSIGHELISRHHNVSIVLGSSFKHRDCHKRSFEGRTSIREIVFQDNPQLPLVEDWDRSLAEQIATNKGFYWRDYLSDIFLHTHSFCSKILNTTEIWKLENQNFDLVIVDSKMGIMMYCIYVIPYTLKVPYVASSTVFSDVMTGRPFLPSIIPSPHSHFIDQMSFLERLQNGGHEVFFHLLSMYSIPMDVVGEFSRGMTRSGVVDLASKAELYLFNTDVILNYPVPRMPNHVFVGGIATRPANPLTGEFAKMYSQTSKDIVIVTFGSTFASLPTDVEANLLSALKTLNAAVIWEYTGNHQDGNVRIVPWAPQNDLLGNPKTKLFVSHCGQNGLFEALYHGVPILCTPIYGDQFFNAARVESWKVGTVLHLLTASEDDIFSAMTEMLENSLFSINMRKASEMYRSRGLNPRQQAGNSIEYVLKFGAAHLRSRASDMSMFTFMGYDIVLFLTIVMCLTLYALFKIVSVLIVGLRHLIGSLKGKVKAHKD